MWNDSVWFLFIYVYVYILFCIFIYSYIDMGIFDNMVFNIKLID